MATQTVDTQKTSEDVIRRLTDNEDLIDILIDIEDYLDSNDLYVYKNWHLGEVVGGPFTKPYWVKVTLKYPYHRMPDPEGGLRLLMHGTKIHYRIGHEKVPIKVKSEADYQPGTKKPKMKVIKVWLIDLLIPRKFVQNLDNVVMDQYAEEVDVETVDDANAEGVSAEGAVANA
jgi:hypothetical protein